MYDSWCEKKKKSYEEYAEKSSVLVEKAEILEERIEELEQRKSSQAEEVETERIKLDIAKIEPQEAVDKFENVQKAYGFIKQFTINGLNILWSLLGKRCKVFQRISVLVVGAGSFSKDNGKRNCVSIGRT